MAIVHIKPLRSDNRYPVTFIYPLSNHKRYNKLIKPGDLLDSVKGHDIRTGSHIIALLKRGDTDTSNKIQKGVTRE